MGMRHGEGDAPGSASTIAEEVSDKRVAGFVELAPQFPWTAHDLYAELERVPGVLKVSWFYSLVGDHKRAHNILVWSEAASKPLEFEVKLWQQSPSSFAVSVCFKEPPMGLIPEAWRILRTVSAGKQLFPDLFATEMRRALREVERGPCNTRRGCRQQK